MILKEQFGKKGNKLKYLVLALTLHKREVAFYSRKGEVAITWMGKGWNAFCTKRGENDGGGVCHAGRLVADLEEGGTGENMRH